MSSPINLYKGYRFPSEIIRYAVWLYYRFNLSHRDIEDLLSERGILVSYEAIRLWCNKFGPKYGKRLRRRHRGFGDTFYLDEVFVKIHGELHYLWRAVDLDGEILDVFVQIKRDRKAARRFLARLLASHGGKPRRWRGLDEEIDAVTADLDQIAKNAELCRRVNTVPGVGPIVGAWIKGGESHLHIVFFIPLISTLKSWVPLTKQCRQTFIQHRTSNLQ